MGFMMTEIGLMQRLMIFLGHPIYSVSVVLFLLLVCGGAGSFVAGRYFKHYRWFLGALLGVLIVVGVITSGLVSAFQSQTTPVRIGLAVLILVPLSFFMGMPFGIGLKLANRGHKHLTPWFWAINGAVSVLASVLAVIVAISRGIHTTLTLGIICYAAAFAALLFRKLFR
jgi:uncharacterized membrane protein YfcA